jgi:hypothetical protein
MTSRQEVRYHDVMTAITVRLSPEDHKLLQLYCAVTGRSQNAVLTHLLRAEIDRVLPGKRAALTSGHPDALWDAIGVPRPNLSPEAVAWADGVLDSLADGDDSGRSAA